MSRRLLAVISGGAGAVLLAALLHAATGTTAVFQGKEPSEAAASLLAAGEKAAGQGSWERIAIGAVYYESGDKAKGQAIFDTVLNGKPEWSDYQRIGRLYADLGEWEKAKPLLDKAVGLKKKAALYAEVGAWYYLNGEKEKGEELFAKAFAAEGDDPWAHAMAAEAYLGQKPRYW